MTADCDKNTALGTQCHGHVQMLAELRQCFAGEQKIFSTTFIQFSFSSQFCVRNVLILLNVYKVRGLK